jgi:ribosomal-protein-serine acetyltransferase
MVPARPLLPDRALGPRVELRRWVAGDADALAASIGTNLDHLRPWMPWIAAEPLTVAERIALIREWERDWRAGGEVLLGAFVGGRIVGGCGLHRRSGPDELEIGYWLDAACTGRGLATEMAHLLTTAAFTVPDIVRTSIHHDKANLPSGRIPARLGYTFVGESPDEVSAPGEVGIDCAWSMQSEAWRRTSAG